MIARMTFLLQHHILNQFIESLKYIFVFSDQWKVLSAIWKQLSAIWNGSEILPFGREKMPYRIDLQNNEIGNSNRRCAAICHLLNIRRKKDALRIVQLCLKWLTCPF